MFKMSKSLITLSLAVALYLCNPALANPAPDPSPASAIAFASAALESSAAELRKAAKGPTARVPFFSPLDGGGSELDIVSPGLGEPMNVIISGLSDPRVLTDDGFLNWAQSVNMSGECFGQHLGGPQSANLGDGNGAVDQTMELRHDFGNTEMGTCLESLIGGNHLRMYRQNGTKANSGALFLAVSKEEDLAQHHTIIPDGYDIGRDLVVSAALNNGGRTSHNGVTYKASSKNITGLLTPGSKGVNHGIAIDGVVVLLTISIMS